MASTTHKKLVVFDVNLDWKFEQQNDYKYKDMPLVYDLITKAVQYQPIIIQTTECLVDAIGFANSLNLKSGYLIASGGSIVYDIAQAKILQILNMDNDDVRTAVHHGLMYGLNVSIYTPDRKFMYISNTAVYATIKDKFYSPYDVIIDYDLLKKTLERTDIVDVGYLHALGTVNNQKQDILLNNLEKYWEQEVCNVAIKLNRTSKYVHIGHKKANKLNGIEKVMEIEKVQNQSDVLYIAASCVNGQCYNAFKNCLLTSNPDFINEIGNRKQHLYLAENLDKLDPEFGLKLNSFWK